MINGELLEAALDRPEGLADITRVEFEVLESGAVRWILWDGDKRLFSCGLDRADLVEALQTSGVLIRMMMLALHDSGPNR